MIRLLIKLLRGDPLQSEREKLDEAQQNYARQAAENSYMLHMRTYYTTRCQKIDPNEDWWLYATMRQKLEDAESDLKLQRAKMLDAAHKLDAREAQVAKLQEKNNDAARS